MYDPRLKIGFPLPVTDERPQLARKRMQKLTMDSAMSLSIASR